MLTVGSCIVHDYAVRSVKARAVTDSDVPVRVTVLHCLSSPLVRAATCERAGQLSHYHFHLFKYLSIVYCSGKSMAQSVNTVHA